MNAIDFLIKEHNRVRALMADISDPSHQFDTQRKRFELLSQELLRHETMEHTIWYPYFKNELPDTVKHLVSEEKSAEKAIHKIDALKTQEAWEENFQKFMDDVEHHAKEEENELFPEVQKILSEQELENIGLKMHAYKKAHS